MVELPYQENKSFLDYMSMCDVVKYLKINKNKIKCIWGCKNQNKTPSPKPNKI